AARGLVRDVDGGGDVHLIFALDALREVLAGEVLHHHVEAPAIVLADIEDLDDVLALHARGGARLLAEALRDLLASRVLRLDELDGDAFTDFDVRPLEDGTHAALANQ